MRGYVIPTYNYAGPGNSLNKGFPTSFLDFICQLHDMDYAYSGYTSEMDDDTIFLTRLENWGTANAGNGWLGPTFFEKQYLIPAIQEIFHHKKYDQSDINGKSWGSNAFHWDVMAPLLEKFKSYDVFTNKQDINRARLLQDHDIDQFTTLVDDKRQEISALLNANGFTENDNTGRKFREYMDDFDWSI